VRPAVSLIFSFFRGLEGRCRFGGEHDFFLARGKAKGCTAPPFGAVRPFCANRLFTTSKHDGYFPFFGLPALEGKKVFTVYT